MIDFIKKHYYVIIFSILLIIFLPNTLIMPALTNTRAIITGVSIDKEEDEYTIALQLITPQSNISNNENLEIIEDTGNTILECFNNLSIKLGKVVGLEHANIIVLSTDLKDEDLMNILDYLYRNTKITMSTLLLQTDSDAKKLLETSAELNNNSSSSLQNNLGFSNSIIESSNVTTLGTFFNDYFSYSKVSFIPYIELPKEEDKNSGSGGESSSSSSEQGDQSGSSSSSGQSIQPLVQNNGKSTLYKDGKFFDILSKELSTGFSWLEGEPYRGNVKVENVSDKHIYNNSTVTVKVENSTRNIKSRIENNLLYLDINVNIYGFVSEIIDTTKSRTIKQMNINTIYLNDALIEKIKEKVENTILDSLAYCKENNIDAFKTYDIFYKHNKKDFRKVLNIYGENYLDALNFNIKINVRPFK